MFEEIEGRSTCWLVLGFVTAQWKKAFVGRTESLDVYITSFTLDIVHEHIASEEIFCTNLEKGLLHGTGTVLLVYNVTDSIQ